MALCSKSIQTETSCLSLCKQLTEFTWSQLSSLTLTMTCVINITYCLHFQSSIDIHLVAEYKILTPKNHTLWPKNVPTISTRNNWHLCSVRVWLFFDLCRSNCWKVLLIKSCCAVGSFYETELWIWAGFGTRFGQLSSLELMSFLCFL